jgi:hypothetical protein
VLRQAKKPMKNSDNQKAQITDVIPSLSGSAAAKAIPCVKPSVFCAVAAFALGGSHHFPD